MLKSNHIQQIVLLINLKEDRIKDWLKKKKVLI